MKKQLFSAVLLLSVLLPPAKALDVTANAGVVSEYVFRGVPSSDGKAAAQGGFDLEWDVGFYLGAWGSGVDINGKDGVEADFYGGYKGEYNDFSYGIGATVYTYTDDVDEDYQELSLSGAWKWFSVAYAAGEYDALGGPDVDYDFWSVTAEYEGLYATFGSLGGDLFKAVNSDYYEAGYRGTLSVADQNLFDFSIAWIASDSGLLIGTTAENRLVFGVTKTFDIAN